MSKENVWFSGKENGTSSSLRRIAPYFSVLETNCENKLLLGASELGGSFWNGSIWLFQKPEDAPDLAKSIAGIEMDVGATDAKFLPNGNQFIVADFSVSISLMDVLKAADDCPVYFTRSSSFKSHDDYVTCLDLGNSGTTMVSGSMDASVLLWDIENCLRKQGFSHASAVLAIAMQPEQDSIFATATENGSCFIWDGRLERPASMLARSPVSYSSLDWITDSVIAVADMSGNLSLVDIRQRKPTAVRRLSKNHSVRRIRANRSSQLLACAVDDLSVRVFFCQEGKLRSLYESHCHKDFVSGLTWSESCRLHTCGWDSQVVSHVIPSVNSLPDIVGDKSKHEENQELLSSQWKSGNVLQEEEW